MFVFNFVCIILFGICLLKYKFSNNNKMKKFNSKEFQNYFEKKYKNKTLTYKIIKEDKKLNTLYIPDDHPYKCQLCINVIEYADAYGCEECDVKVCLNCSDEKF